MKILILTGDLNYCNGVTTYLHHLISILEKKNTFLIIASNDEASSKFNYPNVRIKVIKELDYNKRSIFNYLLASIKLALQLLKFSPNIIHSNNHYTANIAKSVSFFYPFKLNLVQTVHSDFENNGKLKKLKADKYIFVNKHFFDIAQKKNSSVENKHYLIFNGINFNNTIQAREAKKQITILVAGRLEKSKGIHTVVEAISKLANKYKKHILFLIAGTGSYKNKILDSISKLNINYSYLGNVKNMESVYLKSDVFIFPSITDIFGYTWLEAINFECFLIISNFKGGQHLIEQDDNYLCFDKDSSTDLCNKIIFAYELGDQRKAKAKQLKEKLKNKYSSERMANLTYQVYIK